eukprot:COSAG06_NODE_5907_length_3217_cov_4.295382_4_plen_114_part_00
MFFGCIRPEQLVRTNVLSKVHARTRDCEQRGVRRARTAAGAEGPRHCSKEFWVFSLPVLPGYRSGNAAAAMPPTPWLTATKAGLGQCDFLVGQPVSGDEVSAISKWQPVSTLI